MSVLNKSCIDKNAVDDLIVRLFKWQPFQQSTGELLGHVGNVCFVRRTSQCKCKRLKGYIVATVRNEPFNEFWSIETVRFTSVPVCIVTPRNVQVIGMLGNTEEMFG